MDPLARLRLADDFMRRFAAALRGAQLYAPSHPLVQRAFEGLDESITQLLNDQPTIAIVTSERKFSATCRAARRRAMGKDRRLRAGTAHRFDRGVSRRLQTLALSDRAS